MRRTVLAIAGMIITLAVFLFVIRGRVIGFDWDFLFSGWYLRQTLGASFYDIMFIESLLAVFLVLCWVFRRRSRA